MDYWPQEEGPGDTRSHDGALQYRYLTHYPERYKTSLRVEFSIHQ